MNWVALLIIGLASLAVVVGGFAYLGVKAWRLLKRGMRVSRDVAPLADHLSRQAAELTANADRLSADNERLNASLARLRLSVARLQVLIDALSDAAAPFRRIKEYLGM